MTIEARYYVILRVRLKPEALRAMPLSTALVMPFPLIDALGEELAHDLTFGADATDSPTLSFWCDTHEQAWFCRRRAIKILHRHGYELTGEN